MYRLNQFIWFGQTIDMKESYDNCLLYFETFGYIVPPGAFFEVFFPRPYYYAMFVKDSSYVATFFRVCACVYVCVRKMKKNELQHLRLVSITRFSLAA